MKSSAGWRVDGARRGTLQAENERVFRGNEICSVFDRALTKLVDIVCVARVALQLLRQTQATLEYGSVGQDYGRSIDCGGLR